MKIVYYESRLAKLLLRGGYPTIMLFGFVLTKRPALDERSLRHEEIHAVQWRECFYAGWVAMLLLLWGGGFSWWLVLLPLLLYYVWYVTEWMVRFAGCFFNRGKKDVARAGHEAYRNVVMEREAYAREGDKDYPERRGWFAFLRYYRGVSENM